MDSRTRTFVKKFSSARRLLRAGPADRVISLKYREHCANHSEYTHFIEDHLKDRLGLCVKPVAGELQGSAWIVSDIQDNSVILVEHETGLELLYIVGSIASLVSLVPAICSGWNFIRNRYFGPRNHAQGQGIEIRQLGPRNVLIERHVLSIETHVLNVYVQESATMKARLEDHDKEIKRLKNMIAGKGKLLRKSHRRQK